MQFPHIQYPFDAAAGFEMSVKFKTGSQNRCRL